MPIKYQVLAEGHFIHAVASGKVTREEFVEFEVAHAIDDTIKSPVKELLEIQPGSFGQLTLEDVQRVLDARHRIEKKPVPHRCAIVVSYHDPHAWNLAKLYESMVMLHSPESVIIFGDSTLAKIWLEIDEQTLKE